ncbi:MAG: glycosyltransferase [Bryobacterales bacterium]|nr:glycosyltransferase [Bryobacterales bacterium]
MLRAVTVTCSFPNPCEPGHSPFVRARLAEAARSVELKVVAPVPLIDYGNPRGNPWQSFSIPGRRLDQNMEVFHPRWFYPPFGTPINIPCLAARAALTLRSLRRGFDFDLIDSHFGYPDGAAAVLLGRWFRRPAVITLRGNEMIWGREAGPRRCLRWAFRHAAHIIAVSEELRQFALSLGADAGRCTTIPNGVDASIFYPRDREAGRREFGVDSGARLIVSAGGLGPMKGHQVTIEALAGLRASGLDAHLLIAGTANRDGRYEKEIAGLIAARGLEDRVRMLGRLEPPRLAALMSAADVFCLASFAEGWPNVVHEALACGTPVVGTAVGGIPEMTGRGERGLVVPANNVTELEQALAGALRRPWDRQAIAAWGQARSWGHVAGEVVQVFEQVAREHGRAGK